MDLNVTPQHDIPLWNGTRWLGCWCPDAGAGLYLHVGRVRGHLDLWWIQVAANLPETRLCVDRFYGPNTRNDGVRAGALDIEVFDGGWRSTYDGMGQLTSIDELSRAPRGASAPTRQLRWEVESTAVSDVWDMYGDRGDERLFMATDTHIQQGGETTGWLEVGDERYELNGVSFLDHSSGERDMDQWTRHSYFMIVGPEWTAHLLGLGESEDGNPSPWGAFIRRDGTRGMITELSFPSMADSAGGPRHSELTFAISSGEHFEFDAELVHTVPITITEANDNINGVDWDVPGDPVIFSEGAGRFVAPDGQIVYGFHERSARRSMLTRPHEPAGATPLQTA